MSQVYTSDDKIMCNNIPGLVNIQRQLCQNNPDVMVATGKGAKLGVEECQRQMKDQRWNCSTVPRENSVFGTILKKGRLNCSNNPLQLIAFNKRHSDLQAFAILLSIPSVKCRRKFYAPKIKQNGFN